MGTFDDLSPAERDQIKQFRDRGFRSLKKLCLIQLGVSAVSFIVGIVVIVVAAANPQFPYVVAAPMWSAVLVSIGAACGFLATKHGMNKDDVSSQVKAYVIIHYVFNVLCITVCIFSTGFSIIGIVFCRSSDPKLAPNCQPNNTPLMATCIVSAVVGLILAICCMLGTWYFCCYARSLGFKSKREYRMERRLQAMQKQLNEMRAQNAGQGQYSGQGQLTGQGQVNEGYYQWNSDIKTEL